MKKIIKNNKGFTLTELLISMIIALVIIIIVGSTFVLNQKVLRKGNTTAELTQNARITIDLMSREIRQTNEMITTLLGAEVDAVHELQFEDGHAENQIQYIKYYLDSTDLKKQIIVYYFDTEPGTYVYWDDIDAFGSPSESILEDKIISENLSSINFWGTENLNIEVIFIKNDEQVEMKSIINPRNI